MNGPHPALRLPGHDGPVTHKMWDALPATPEGVPLFISPSDEYLSGVGPDWDAPLGQLTHTGLVHLARHLPQLKRSRTALRRAVRSMLGRYVDGKVDLGVEAGCSVGADLRPLSRVANRVIAFDRDIVALRAAAQVLEGQSVAVPVRDEGHVFHWTKTPISMSPVRGVTLVCADALNPPVQVGAADVVVAINLLEAVATPLALIGQLDTMLRPGGILILASSFDWAEAITPADEQLGGGTALPFAGTKSAELLPLLLTGQGPVLQHCDYMILDEIDVPWRLREHARCMVHYSLRLIVARKGGA